MRLRRRRSSIPAGLVWVTLLAAAAAVDPLPEDKAKFFQQYAPNLHEACTKAKLELMLRAMHAVDMVHHFQNPLLAVTLFALDDDAWRDLAQLTRPGTRVNKLFTDTAFIKQILQAHMVDYPFFTNYWPQQGSRSVSTMLSGKAVELLIDRNGTYSIRGFQSSGELICSASDLRAGASVLHVLSLRRARAGQAALVQPGAVGQAAAAGALAGAGKVVQSGVARAAGAADVGQANAMGGQAAIADAVQQALQSR